MTKAATKPFFHIGKPSVEYSTDFDFFLKNQISVFIDRSGYPTVNFNSRLESRRFDRIKNITRGEITEEEIVAKCKEIHKRLMNGEFGTPTFVN